MAFDPSRLVIKPVYLFGAYEAAEGPRMFEGIAQSAASRGWRKVIE
jgi:hypothetical protein